MSRLRSYAKMPTVSAKTRAVEGAFRKVYDEVDARSGGRCEVHVVVGVKASPPDPAPLLPADRCPRRAVEHHHLFKPRRSNHATSVVVHVCRSCHDRLDWPFKRGRLCYLGTNGAGASFYQVFLFSIRYANDKWEARRNHER